MSSFTAISYGGGVQSTALLVLAVAGRLDVDVALFANTGDDSEHPATLAYFRDVAAPFAARHGFDLIELRKTRRNGEVETLRGRLMRDGSRSLPIPVRMANGAPGTRGCTRRGSATRCTTDQASHRVSALVDILRATGGGRVTTTAPGGGP